MSFASFLSLRVKLPAIMACLVVSALLITGYLSARNVRIELLSAAKDSLFTLQETIGRKVTFHVEASASAVSSMAAHPVYSESFTRLAAAWASSESKPEARQELIDEFRGQPDKDLSERGSLYSLVHGTLHGILKGEALENGYSDILMVNTKGEVFYSLSKDQRYGTTLDLEGRDQPLETAVKGALASGTLGVANSLGSGPGGHLILAAPIRDSFEELVGVMVYKLDARAFGALARLPKALRETATMQLLDANGRVIVMDGQDRSFLLPENLPDDFNQVVGRAQSATFEGQEFLHSVQDISALGIPLRLVFWENEDVIAAPAQAFARQQLEIALWVSLAAVLVVALYSHSVAVPLLRVRRAMGQIARGDFAGDVPHVKRRDEIGGIASTLEKFRNSIMDAEQIRRDAAAQGAGFESSSAALVLVDKSGALTHGNSAFRALLEQATEGHAPMLDTIMGQDFIGLSVQEIFAGQDRFLAAFENPNLLPYSGDIPVGQGRLHVTLSRVAAVEGEAQGLVIEWEDVTARRSEAATLRAIDANMATAHFASDGQFLTANDVLLKALGSDVSRLEGLSIQELFAFESQGSEATVLANGGPLRGKFEVRLPSDDVPVVLDSTFTAVLDPSGHVVEWVLIAHDITEVEAKVREAQQEQAVVRDAQTLVMGALTDALSLLSQGNLLASIEGAFPEDYEDLRADYNRAVTQLRDAVLAVIENVVSIQAETQEITSAADDLSRRTETQAATLEETAAALDQLTANMKDASRDAGEAQRVVTEAKSNAEDSGKVVAEAVKAMDAIDQSSEKISQIIGVIDEIAFQTNLLALNAGVEAARAGDAGRGFAVVASEVRALAQRSADAAQEIGDLIEQSSASVKHGVGLVDETGQVLKGIVQSFDGVASRVSQIADANEEQSRGLGELNEAVRQLDAVTQQNAALFEETTAASHTLVAAGRKLAQTTARFQVGIEQAAEAPPEVAASAPSKHRVPSAAVIGANAVKFESELQDGWEEF